MPFVLDANIVVAACLAGPSGFTLFGAERLLSPDLMWWEAASTLHEYLWRIDASRRTADMATLQRDDVVSALKQLHLAPIERVPTTPELLADAWDIASRSGFARLYAAAYVALAIRAGAKLVTLDGRLKASPAASLASIVGPTELG